MTTKRALTRDDIVPMGDFASMREEKRSALLPKKKLRRIALGPWATLYFECFETMWFQIHEMLLIEKGGEQQIEDELAAYNPLIPGGGELVATLMFEIDDEERRARVLLSLGGVEEHVYFEVAGEKAYARPEQEVERTTADGKTSAVHFLHFDLTDIAQANLAKPDTRALIGCDHANYAHMAVLSDASRNELVNDL